jgi:hypothetical protein
MAETVLALEAEAGQVTPMMMRVTDSAASGGAYVRDGNPAGMSGYGQIILDFTLDSSGDFNISCRTLAPSEDRDSFFIALDGEPDQPFITSTCPASPDWQWVDLPSGPVTCPGTLPAPRRFSLSAGAHELVFASREGQSAIDRIDVRIADP